jgi:hypothetical protein
MRLFLSIFCVLLISQLPASAHLPAPLTWYLENTKSACFATVTAINGNKISFVVTDILKGEIDHTLTLLRYPDFEKYTLGSEWLLTSCAWGFGGGTVGWANKGDCGWIPAAVIRAGGNVYVTDWTTNIPANAAETLASDLVVMPNGERGYNLDHVKTLLNAQPAKKT